MKSGEDRPASHARDGGQADAPGTEVGDLVRRLSSGEDLNRRARGRLMARLGAALADNARKAGGRGVAGGRWLVDVFAEDIAPRIPIRDLDALRAHHQGRTGEALADSLVEAAARSAAAVGAAGGVLAAAEYGAPPTLVSVPVQIAAETLVVAAIETKLIAELHEAYGVQVPGNRRQQGVAFVQAWGRQRGIDPLRPGSMTLALGTAAKQALRRRLMRLFGRNISTLGPFLTGAVAGGALNYRGTHRLGALVRGDLRGRVIGVSSSHPNQAPGTRSGATG